MKLNLILAKTFQFVVSLLFITMVLFYGSVLLMFPLAVLVYAVKIASLLAPTAVAVVIGVAALAYLGREVSRMPELLGAILGVGSDLVAFGYQQKERFDPIIEAAQAGKTA
ncbi:MAG: hypothetical protein ACKN9T_10950 [Candidatus Methylumidiphilus sp.]